jgi:spore coat protein U-like protein
LSQATERKLAVGDFAEVQFDACVQETFESVGKAREVVTAVNATQTIFQAHGELTGFGNTDATGVTTLETGPYDLSVDRTSAVNIKISSSSAKAVNVERRINQRANAAYSLTNLKRAVEGNAAAGTVNFNSSYTASGSFPVLGATRFQVNTLQPLSIGLDNGVFTGVVKVAGAGGSTLELTFLSPGVSVRLDLDANGDGTIDQSQMRTFDALLQLVLAP